MFRCIAATTIVWVAILFANRAVADCKQPELTSFLENSRGALKFPVSEQPYFRSPVAHKLEFKIGARTFQWFGVGWEAPPDGALFVLDCAGQRFVGARLGQVRTLHKGPVLSPVGQTVEVQYVAQTGSGYKRESVDIFAFQNNTLKSLWTHTVREHSFPLPLEEGTIEEYQWMVSADGQRIRVNGSRTVYPPKSERLDEASKPPTTHKVSPGTFCWDRIRIAYIACSLSQ